MADAQRRSRSAAARLRNRLRKNRESLADHFDFHMYIVFTFKDENKKQAVFEVREVIPMMANNYEHSIMQGVAQDEISMESSINLLSKDAVQLHANHWRSLRSDVIGCEGSVDLLMWPRKDISHIDCHLFSRWKGNKDENFRPLETTFRFEYRELEKHILRLMITKDKNSHILNNPEESLLLFINKHIIERPSKSSTMILRLVSLCLYMDQDQLTRWAPGTMEEYMDPILSDM